MSHLVIELLNNLTRTWDYYGASKEQVLHLTKESFEELDGVIFLKEPIKTAPGINCVFLFNGFIITAQYAVDPMMEYFKNNS